MPVVLDTGNKLGGCIAVPQGRVDRQHGWDLVSALQDLVES